MSSGPKPGLLVEVLRGDAAHLRRTDHGAHEEMPALVHLAAEMRRRDPDHGAIGLELLRQVGAAEHRRRRAVADGTRHHGGQRPRHHAGVQHLLDGDRLLRLALAHRVQRAVVPVLGRDGGQVLRLRAALVHAARGPHREERRRQDGLVHVLRIRRRADDGGHLVEAEHERGVVVTARDGEVGFAHRRGAGGGGVLDALDRHAGHADLLDDPHARHRRHEEMPDVDRVDVREARRRRRRARRGRRRAPMMLWWVSG